MTDLALGRVGAWGHLDSLDVEGARTYVQRVEALGYGTLWVPETVGREPFTLLGMLAGETGRLVLVEMVAPDVAGALNRALAFFPPEEREIGRLRLAENLRAASAQLLLDRDDDQPGRVGAWEVLPVDDAVRAALREPDGVAAIAALLAKPGDSGRLAFGAALEQLKAAGTIGEDTHRIAAASVGTPAPTRRTRRSR